MTAQTNKILLCLAVFAATSTLSPVLCEAQTVTEVVVDSTAFLERTPSIDSTLAGTNIFDLIDEAGADGAVTIRQSPAVRNALEEQIAGNAERKISGFRVRIYFNNSQNARSRSQAVAEEFASLYPQMRVYRSYSSPYFKVTVGDFRTKGEAQRFADSISGDYPSVFLVRENINYPEI